MVYFSFTKFKKNENNLYLDRNDLDAIHNACKKKLNLLVGTYTTKCDKGIYVYDFDADFKYKMLLVQPL
jgi:hypothetical protein